MNGRAIFEDAQRLARLDKGQFPQWLRFASLFRGFSSPQQFFRVAAGGFGLAAEHAGQFVDALGVRPAA